MKKLMLFFLICLVLLAAGCGPREGNSSSDPSSSAAASDVASLPTSSLPDIGEPSESGDAEEPPESGDAGEPSEPGDAADASAASVPQGRRAVRVTIPEGYSVSQIGDTLESKGVCKKEAFLETLGTYDFTYYPLVAAIPQNASRCYKLEGYLFPDTYDFYTDMKPQDAIGKMLRAAEAKIGNRYAYNGLSTDQLITIASMVEKEAATTEDMRKVASVIHNRLRQGMKLQTDCTIYYIERYVKPNLTGDINRYNAFYNTYKCDALPAGPICNPGANALKAAANPAETDYLFFVFDTQGNYYYAKTYEEHLQNCEKAGVATG